MKKYLIPSGFISTILILVLICGKISFPSDNHNLQKVDNLALVNQAITASSSDKILHIPILIYHAVRPNYPEETAIQKRYNITPDLFEEQLIYLRDNGYTTISLDQLIANFKNDSGNKIAKPVILTFDDGWHNQYSYAFPLLKKYGVIAIFYIYTNPIGKDERFLTWTEIREMTEAGMAIGSHSLYHPKFLETSPEQLKKEIFSSKKIIEQKIDKPVIHFATPYGDTNNQIEKLIEEAGYQTARTVSQKTHQTEKDLFHLPAYFVPQNMPDFIWLLDKS